MAKVLGIDLNEETLTIAREKLTTDKLTTDRLILVQGNFKNIQEIVAQQKVTNIAGVLLDLGLSTRLLEASGRGLSFLKNEYLDMRFGNSGQTAAELINTATPETLVHILQDFGEEPYAHEITKGIVNARKQHAVATTKELVHIILASTPQGYQRSRIHPATRTFQALRIAVNHELENLPQALREATNVLAPHGRLAVISYHSLEDRIVKTFFSAKGGSASGGKTFKVLTKKPITPNAEEIATNPRSRSAKLRVAQKL